MSKNLINENGIQPVRKTVTDLSKGGVNEIKWNLVGIVVLKDGQSGRVKATEWSVSKDRKFWVQVPEEASERELFVREFEQHGVVLVQKGVPVTDDLIGRAIREMVD